MAYQSDMLPSGYEQDRMPDYDDYWRNRFLAAETDAERICVVHEGLLSLSIEVAHDVLGARNLSECSQEELLLMMDECDLLIGK